MSRFVAEQRVLQVGSVTLGGQLGEYPTVLVGSIFFSGHRIVGDPVKGTFDKAKAKALLEREAELAVETGNPRFIDVVGDTAQALVNYIEFVATYSEAPLLLDSPNQIARMEALRYFAGSDLMPRLIYNSIADDYTEEELACIRECGLKSGVVLAFGPRAFRPQDKLRLIEERLLPAALQAGLENILIDVGVLDIPSVAWAAQAIWEVKGRLGYPAGCAASNPLYQWRMRERGPTPFAAASSVVLTLPQCYGANFILYGSIANAPWVYQACATMDALLAYRARLDGLNVKSEKHPLFRIF